MKFLNNSKYYIFLILIIIQFCFSIVAAQNINERKVLGEEINYGEATVWYLGHCGFAVKTESHFLIFDYVPWEPIPDNPTLSKGFINPEEIANLKVRIFVTHSHTDHFNEVIFDWSKEIPDIKYFFGWDVSHEKEFYHNLVAPRGLYSDKAMEIFTINSHHSGVPEVAYLVKVDGLIIFHGGDYKSDYENDFPYLKTTASEIDFAFLNSVYFDYAQITLQHIKLIEMFDPKAIYPQHSINKEEGYKKFAEYFKSKGFVVPIICAEERGDKFIYKDEKTTKLQN